MVKHTTEDQYETPRSNKKILIKKGDKVGVLQTSSIEEQPGTYNEILTDEPSQVSLFYKLDNLNQKQLKYVRTYMKNTYNLDQAHTNLIGSQGSVFTYGPSHNSMPLIPDNVNLKTHNLTFDFGSIIGGVVGIFKGIVGVQSMEEFQNKNPHQKNLQWDFKSIWQKALDIGKTVINGTQKALLVVNGVVNQAEKIGKIFSYDNSLHQGDEQDQVVPFNDSQIGLQTGWCTGNFQTHLQSTGQVKQYSYKQYNQARNIVVKPALYKCKIGFDFSNPDQSKRGMPLLQFNEVPQTDKKGKLLSTGPLASGAISMIE